MSPPVEGVIPPATVLKERNPDDGNCSSFGNEMKTATDNDLLLASGRGDRDAFILLVRRHHRAVIRFVLRYLATADLATAEDLTQEVFLSAWKYAPAFQPRARVLTWLFRIATNACLNYRRGERARISLVRSIGLRRAESGDGGEGAEGGLARSERARRVRAAIAALPPTQRAAVVLRYYHDFSYAEIATILATSTSAVDSLLHRARRALCGELSVEKK